MSSVCLNHLSSQANYPETAKLPKQFKYADRIGAKLTLVLGPDEAANGQVTVKNLSNGEQVVIPQNEAATVIRKMVG
jgi:histidyl-tRNA synthetase